MLLSKITAKAQTTLPSGVRKALGVRPGDSLAYVIEGDYAIIRKAADPTSEEEDPALGAFLDLLERDIAEHPERLQLVTPELVERIRRATEGIDVDPFAEIEGPVAL
ncbi:MAG TPA: type II toxin-antitoxin system PrlF family antitoxin [Longimicrobium sp.]